jgi:predicted TIM-barrel fold metal-dependent hydrolase
MSGRCGGFEKGALERALELFGADRVLFGSDFTVYEPEAFIARLEEAVDSEVDREKISSLNIQRLLRKTGSRPIL